MKDRFGKHVGLLDREDQGILLGHDAARQSDEAEWITKVELTKNEEMTGGETKNKSRHLAGNNGH